MPRGGSQSLRSLFVIPSLERGGSEGQLVELLSRVHPEPVAATLATLVPARDRLHTETLRASGVPHVILAPRGGATAGRRLAAAFQLGRLLRKLQPDVVYAWGEYASVLAVPIARALRTPVVVARRNSGNVNLAPWLGRAARLTDARAQLVTGNSRAVLDESARYGVPPGRLRLVRNGHHAGRPAPPPRGDVVRLGYVAGLRPGKGHHQLLRALSEVRADTPWRVELAGEGPIVEELSSEVHQNGLAGRVRFLGLVDDIAGFWREHHACVLLSAGEGSSNALIEAGLAGRPLLATDVPGNRELVTPGAGVLVRPGDPSGAARRLEQIIDDAGLRERLGRGASQAMRRFKIERMVAGHLSVLMECVQPGRAVTPELDRAPAVAPA